jgi:hypothetical protein
MIHRDRDGPIKSGTVFEEPRLSQADADSLGRWLNLLLGKMDSVLTNQSATLKQENQMSAQMTQLSADMATLFASIQKALPLLADATGDQQTAVTLDSQVSALNASLQAAVNPAPTQQSSSQAGPHKSFVRNARPQFGLTDIETAVLQAFQNPTVQAILKDILQEIVAGAASTG